MKLIKKKRKSKIKSLRNFYDRIPVATYDKPEYKEDKK